jgi:hypothetical protein
MIDMNTKAKMISIICSIVLLTGISALAQNRRAGDEMLGDWFGESKCTGNNPYCHDEVVIYHFTRSKSDPAKIHLAADKMVNGKPELMGEFEFVYDAEKKSLTAEFTIPRTGGKGVWSFTVDGDKIEGTLTVFPENEIGRRVNVSRKKPAN